MSEFTLGKALSLLERAYGSGIRLSYSEGEITAKFQKEGGIDQELLMELRENKKLLIQYFEKHERADSVPSEGHILSGQGEWGEGIFPLSFAQERLWFIDRLEGSVHYHLPLVFRMYGLVDEAVLEWCFREIVFRHAVLRTVIREREGSLYQEVRDGGGWRMKVLTEAGLIAEGGSIDRYVMEGSREPFDLSADWMLRVSLIRVSESEHVLFALIHHIAFDGWSVPVMVREFAELYRSRAAGLPARLPALTIQYGDYAVWQRKQLQDGVLSRRIGYWTKQLADLQTLELATDFPRPVERSVRGGERRLLLGMELKDRLVQFGREEGVTLFMTMLGAFKILLNRYTGQNDICVGTPAAGRLNDQLEGMIGFFVNMLALRSRIGEGESIAGLIRRVRQTTLDAYEHQDAPFEKIVDAIGGDRDLQGTPVFRVLFALQNTPEAKRLDIGGLELCVEPHSVQTSKFDIQLSAREAAEGIYVSLVYNSDLFRPESVDRMLAHYERLLTCVVDRREEQVRNLSFLTEDETGHWEGQLGRAVSAAGSGSEPDRGGTIVDLFEAQAGRTPDEIALVYEGTALTYRELEERSGFLAALLRQRGVGAGDVVALYIERSLEMGIGILGILRAGAAFVPMDPDHPEERTVYMVKDCGAKQVLGSDGSIRQLGRYSGELADVEMISLERLPEVRGGAEILGEGYGSRPYGIARATDLAYVIYTSGSTGRPKGVMVEHAQVYAYINGVYGELGFEECKTFALLASFSADASIQIIFCSLCFGGSLNVLNWQTVSDPDALEAYLSGHPIDCYKVTPSLAGHLLTYDNIARLLPSKMLVVGGESCSWDLAYRILDVLPETCAFYNHYGPTETTVGVTTCKVTRDLRGREKSVPIGRPLPGVGALVLDEAMNPVPFGVVGDLYIGGALVTRGYLNSSALSVERYIVREIYGKAVRLYSTGDKVKVMADGNIHFLGRADGQVKIRGYRVEPGEIENSLKGIAGIRNAVVAAGEDKAGVTQLTAYVAVDGEIDEEWLWRQLRRQLPEHMIPHHLVQLESLPLTASGKLDRKALPGKEGGEAGSDRRVLPVSEEEQLLAGIWQQLLGVPEIGIHDSFFVLGGHSLLATRLVSAIRKEFKVEIGLKYVFQHPTIALLLAAISERKGGTMVPEIVAMAREGAVPLSYAQERLWFIDALGGSVQYHMPWSFRIRGGLDLAVLEESFRMIMRRHEVLRTVIREEGGVAYQQVISERGWRIHLAAASEHIDELISEPFDLSADYPLRVSVIRREGEDDVLVIVIHHIAFDGWSVSIMVKELSDIYTALYHKKEPVLPLLSLSYADYAIWQRQFLKGGVLEKELDYWCRKLKDAAPLRLPVDFPRSAVLDTKGGTYKCTIGSKLHRELAAFSLGEGVTIYMTLLTAFKVLLYRYSGQNDICVGISVANRTQKGLEGLIGFFVNALAIRTEVLGGAGFRQLLHVVRDNLIEAYEHQETPFEKVIEAVAGKRDLSANPLFGVMFVLHNTPDAEEMQLPGVFSAGEPLVNTTSKFDITFSLTEAADGLKMSIEYAEGLFKPETIKAMAGHYENILLSVVEDSEARAGKLNMLSPKERESILYGFNDSVCHYGYEGTVAGLIGEQCQRTPERVAVTDEGGSLTYMQLHERSERLACYLRERGLRAGDLVPIVAGRSAGMLIGLLGILKAGAAYIPIEPSYPEHLIDHILTDVSAGMLLTDGSCPAFAGGRGYEVLTIGEEMAHAVSEGGRDEESAAGAGDAAYVIYTSGSTGMPKGVMVDHRSLLNYVQNCRQLYLEDADNVRSGSFVNLSYAFDASLTALFVPLVCGRSVVFGPRDQHNAGLFNSAVFNDNGAYSFLKITPSHMPMLEPVLAAWGRRGEKIAERLVFGGEALQAGHLRCLTEMGPDIEVINEYGPTEATVGCCAYHTTAGKWGGGNAIPIGRPMNNVFMYILNSEFQVQPVGVCGELYIGGIQVARGYLNRAGLTDERFLANPFVEGDRLYRTGDLAQWQADGNIRYLGRQDDQVKLRGFRIELGELENLLSGSGLVSSSSWIVKRDDRLGDRLICYCVPDVSVSRDREAGLLLRRIGNWKELYETEYDMEEGVEAEMADPGFNITGWNDSVTGKPIDALHMRDWLDDIVRVLLSQDAGNVLEIGCGTGLIYYQLCGRVGSYAGTDLSSVTIERLKRQHASGAGRGTPSQFYCCPAHELITGAGFVPDTIVMNSVVQYFPGTGYLDDVIGDSVRRLGGKGRIVIGDVRDQRLEEVFKARILLEGLEESADMEKLKWLVQHALLKEEELTLSPDYFYRLRALHPAITHVDVSWKQSRCLNELTRYRYTVVLHVGGEREGADPGWMEWDVSAAAPIRQKLMEKVPVIAIKGVPNNRLWQDRKLYTSLVEGAPVRAIGEIRALMEERDEEDGVVDGLIQLAEAEHYTIRYFVSRDAFRFDLLIALNPSDGILVNTDYGVAGVGGDGVLANDPLFADMSSGLQKELRTWLAGRVPDYMLPAEILVYKSLPLTSNGKTDKRLLAGLDIVRPSSSNGYEQPQTEQEWRLAGIWQELLGRERVGISDNFFELGGHSILMVQLLHRLGDENVSLKDLFLCPTVRQQAELICEGRKQPAILAQKMEVVNEHLLLLKQGKKGMPLFVIPGSTGIADSYDQLAEAIDTEYQVYGIQMQGVLDGEMPLQRVSELAAKHIEWIMSIQPEGPYHIIGHSFGGYVAYEMARQLELSGHAIGLIAIIDVEAESRKKIHDTEEGRIDLLMHIASVIFERCGLIRRPFPDWIVKLREELTGLETIDNIRRRIMELARQRFADRGAEISLVFQLLNLHTTNAVMDRKIIPAVIGTTLTLIKGADETYWNDFSEKLDWDKYFDAVDLRLVPGTHANLLQVSYGAAGKHISDVLHRINTEKNGETTAHASAAGHIS